MQFEKLTFKHKDLLSTKLRNSNIPLSEYSFTNLYLFRNVHEYEVHFGDEIFIKGKHYQGGHYFMPTQDIRTVPLPHLKDLLKEVDFLFPIPEEWLPYFPEDEFEFSFNEADTDYVYTVEKMATYKGRRLSKKRNLLKQFLREYEPHASCINKKGIDDAITILNQWQEDVDSPPEETDYYACLEALKMHNQLSLCGVIYYVDSIPGGFIIAEALTDDMLVLHFAKGEKKFKGLYQFMYNTFAKELPNHYEHLNFEQDLGKLALRIAKSSYVPDAMLKKYRISLKK